MSIHSRTDPEKDKCISPWSEDILRSREIVLNGTVGGKGSCITQDSGFVRFINGDETLTTRAYSASCIVSL